MSFMWMYATARDIERLAGKEFYSQYGQEVLDCLKPHWSVEEEWPEDEEIVSVINQVKERHAREKVVSLEDKLDDAKERSDVATMKDSQPGIRKDEPGRG